MLGIMGDNNDRLASAFKKLYKVNNYLQRRRKSKLDESAPSQELWEHREKRFIAHSEESMMAS